MPSINPHTLQITNPTARVDGTAYDASTETSGYEIAFDGKPAVSLVSDGAAHTTFDLSQISAFTSLASGNHTVAVDIVAKAGGKSALSATFPFTIAAAPLAPVVTNFA